MWYYVLEIDNKTKWYYETAEYEEAVEDTKQNGGVLKDRNNRIILNVSHETYKKGVQN